MLWMHLGQYNMLQSIQIDGFKCFDSNFFDLAPLTILAGKNGSGKTSLLHVLSLMHQTICEAGTFNTLILNGQVLSLGRVSDILNRFKGREAIHFCFGINGKLYEYEYKIDERDGFTLKIKSNSIEGDSHVVEKIFRRMTYLSAERQGPREMHVLEDSILYHNVGVYGERSVCLLNDMSDYQVLEKLRFDAMPPLLIRQVEAHMQEIFEHFQLDLQPIPRTNIATLGLTNDEGIGFVRPQNIGFGLSYCLPIYVACLSSTEGDLVLVENPEAHLHPKAQSRIGEFLARSASAGVQLVVETHSDHLLNGIRKAVKSGVLSASDVAIYFFAGLDADSTPKIFSPRMTADGKLTEWPEDFFDQFDRDLEILVDW